jgi:hypothetical protein
MPYYLPAVLIVDIQLMREMMNAWETCGESCVCSDDDVGWLRRFVGHQKWAVCFSIRPTGFGATLD